MTMRLHSRTGATVIEDPEYGHLEPGKDGSFDLPDDLAERLHRVHAHGEPLWETDIDRNHRVASEELERRQSPEALHDAVARLVQLAESTGAAGAAGATAARSEDDSSRPARKTRRPAAGDGK